MMDGGEAESGPGFERWLRGFELGGRQEFHLGYHLLAFFDVFRLEFPVVDDAEVDLTDGVGVVVEKSDDIIGMVCGDVDFLFDFAGEGGEVDVAIVGAEEGDLFVDGVDVAADSD